MAQEKMAEKKGKEKPEADGNQSEKEKEGEKENAKAKDKDKARVKEKEKASPRKTLILAGLLLVAFFLLYGWAKRRRDPRLDTFASCLSDRRIKLYGLYWCTHCADQKDMFGRSFDRVPYIECGIPGSHEEQLVCQRASVRNFPTWEFPDGSRKEGVQSLDWLSAKSGCPLP